MKKFIVMFLFGVFFSTGALASEESEYCFAKAELAQKLMQYYQKGFDLTDLLTVTELLKEKDFPLMIRQLQATSIMTMDEYKKDIAIDFYDYWLAACMEEMNLKITAIEK